MLALVTEEGQQLRHNKKHQKNSLNFRVFQLYPEKSCTRKREVEKTHTHSREA